MKNWLIHAIGGHTRAEVQRIVDLTNDTLRALIEHHDLQAAWQELKDKRRAVH